MKGILLVSPVPPPYGGIATWTTQYIKYLNCKSDCTTYLVNSAVLKKRIANKKRNIREEYIRANNIKKEIKQICFFNKIDVIHYNSACTFLGLIKDFYILKGIKHKNIVFHCRCDLNNYASNFISKILFKKISKLSNTILVLNTQSKDYVMNVTGMKAKLLPNFIDIELDPYRIREFTKFKKFIYTGRISKEKGCDKIIELAKLIPDWEFVLIGDSNQDIDLSTISNNVIIKGQMSREETLLHLKTASVFLFLSNTEGFSNSLLEAMAFGLPVITTNVGANFDMIEDKGGILVDTSDISSCLEKILSYVKDNEKLNCSSKFNYEKVSNNYLIDNVVDKMLQIY